MKLPYLQNIRSRLTIWHLLVFGGILVLYAGGTFAFLFVTLNRQIDDGLKEDLEIVEQILAREPEGAYFATNHPGAVDPLERYMEIWSAEGTMVYRSSLFGNRSLGPVAPFSQSNPSIGIESVVLPGGEHWRIASTVPEVHGKPLLLRLAISEDEYFSDLRRGIFVLLLGIPVALVLVIFSGYVMAWASLRPIDLMARRARRIGTRNLAERIPVRNPNDELGRLAIAFNDLLERIERGFGQLKRFTADASHELRTPLTAMRSVGEVALEGDHTKAEYREIIGSMLEESSRLTRLVDSLLFLSRADAGKIEIHPEGLDLRRLATDAANLMMILAEDRHQNLTVNGDTDVIVTADRQLLHQALLSILDNAIKYSPSDTTIMIQVQRDDQGTAELAVRDQGSGIPREDLERIFDRFFRIHQGPDYQGTGLGLAIVKWAVEANGGTVVAESIPGKGSTIRLQFPVARRNP